MRQAHFVQYWRGSGRVTSFQQTVDNRAIVDQLSIDITRRLMKVQHLPTAHDLTTKQKRALYWHLEKGKTLSAACRRASVNYLAIQKHSRF